MPTSFVVRNETELNAAIAAANGGASGTAYGITIDASGSFDLATDLTPIALPAGASLAISGDVDLDGHGLVHGFSVASGNVTFAKLSISGTLAPVAGGPGWAVNGGLGVNLSFQDVDFANFHPEGASGTAIHTGGTLFIRATGSLDLPVDIDANTVTIEALELISGIGSVSVPSSGPALTSAFGTTVSTGVLTLATATTNQSFTGTSLAAGTFAFQEVLVTNFTVDSDASLRAAITAISLGGVSAGSSSYTITLAADIALSGNLPAIDLGANRYLTIDGQGHTLDGESVARGFYLYSGSVTFRDLTIADAVARGGDGDPGVNAGGGAAGLGGGLFIAQNAAAVLDGVTFRDDSAIGGAGGTWVNPGAVPAGSDTVPSAAFGFGGNGAGVGGGGGFGGGGAGGAIAGMGGFGAGDGGAGPLGAGGGGGLGAGGDIFVHAGGNLTILSATLAAGSVAGGTGRDGGGNGSALGTAIFLSGNQPFTLAPPAGKTIVIDGVIADTPVVGEPAGSGTYYSGGTAGSVSTNETIYFDAYSYFAGFPFADPYVLPADPSLPMPGGTVVLNGANTYASGTRVTGTLELGNAEAAGSGTITFAADQGVVRIRGDAAPANVLVGLSRRETVDFRDIALVSGLSAVDPASRAITLARLGGGSVTLHTAGDTAAHLAASVTPDGQGGSAITLVYAASVPGAPGGTMFVPMGNGAYVNAAQAMIGAAGGGGVAAWHAGGMASVPAGTGIFAADPTSALVLTGAATDGQLILTGTGDLGYLAGAGSATLVSGGGNNLISLPGGSGNQTIFLGNGADTVLSAAGHATIDGNLGGKLVLFGGGEQLFVSHAGGLAADTVIGGAGAASVASHGNLYANGHFGSLDFNPISGTSWLLGVTGQVRMESNAGTALITTDGTLTLDQPTGATTLLGGGGDTRLLVTAGKAGDIYQTRGVSISYLGAGTVVGAMAGGLVSGGAGSMTVTAAYQGVLLGGSAGLNRYLIGDGNVTIGGGGPGDVVSLGGHTAGLVFGGAGAVTMDGASGSGNVTWVAGAGATTLSTGTGHNIAWLGAGAAQVTTHGADTIVGGTGNATISPGATGVLAFAGAGSMTFLNGAGASTVVGAGGALTLFGGAGGGLFLGGGAGLLTADGGAATLVGGGAGDVLSLANGANNLVVGGSGGETLGGAAATGTNVIYAGSGPDLLIGGAGTSFLFAGAGNDTLREGSGLTQFVFVRGLAAGHVTIENWDPGHAQVALTGYGAGEATTALAGAVNAGGDTSITLSDGTEITFLGAGGLSAGSFI